MQTVTLQVEDQHLGTVLNLISNLKEGIIKKYEIYNENDSFLARKKILSNIKEQVDKNKMKIYDFNSEIDLIIKKLKNENSRN